jgi:hypothetical protein
MTTSYNVRNNVSTSYNTRQWVNFLMTQDLDFLMTQDNKHIVLQDSIVTNYTVRDII